MKIIGNEIVTARLLSKDRKYNYYIINGIASFVPSSNYSNSFGKQWSVFCKTQLDSYSKIPISENRFYKATNWKKSELKNPAIIFSFASCPGA